MFKWIPNDFLSVPARVYSSVSPLSASVAATGAPMFAPDGVFSATLRVVLVPSVNVGATFSLSTIVNVATARAPSSVAFTGLLSLTVNVSSPSTSASSTSVTVKHARCCWGWSATVPLCET